MRVVTRYSVIFFPSSCISKSATRAHLIPRTVLAASPTAFSAALAKLSLEAPTISMIFCAMFLLLGPIISEYETQDGRAFAHTRAFWESTYAEIEWFPPALKSTERVAGSCRLVSAVAGDVGALAGVHARCWIPVALGQHQGQRPLPSRD